MAEGSYVRQHGELGRVVQEKEVQAEELAIELKEGARPDPLPEPKYQNLLDNQPRSFLVGMHSRTRSHEILPPRWKGAKRNEGGAVFRKRRGTLCESPSSRSASTVVPFRFAGGITRLAGADGQKTYQYHGCTTRSFDADSSTREKVFRSVRAAQARSQKGQSKNVV